MKMASQSEHFDDFFFTGESIDHHNHYFDSSSDVAAWSSPVWQQSSSLSSSSSLSKSKEYRQLAPKEPKALPMDMTENTKDRFSIPKKYHTSHLSSTVPGMTHDDPYPIFFSDPVENGSVQTGISQQELLRKKARESTTKTRYYNNNNNTTTTNTKYSASKKKKRDKMQPVIQITGFLSSRTSVSSRNRAEQSRNTIPPSSPWKYMGNQVSMRTEEVELSTAETTVTDSTSSRYVTRNPSSPLRVVLNDGNLMLAAKRQRNRIPSDLSYLEIGTNDDFPLLSRSASESFQTDSFSEYHEKDLFDDKPSTSLPNRTRKKQESRYGYVSNYNNSIHHQSRSEPPYRQVHLSQHDNTTDNSTSYVLEKSQKNEESTQRHLLHQRHLYNSDRNTGGEEEEEEENKFMGKKHHNRQVRFSTDNIMSASKEFQKGPLGKYNNLGVKPKSILRTPRYHVEKPDPIASPSPLRFSIRKPVTPETIEYCMMKSPRSVSSPSTGAVGIFHNDQRPLFSPIYKDSMTNDLSTQSNESYPDPPLDSVNIEDDDTTYASRNDAFLHTIAAIVIQAAIRRFLATRYVNMLKQQIAMELNTQNNRARGNGQQTNLKQEVKVTNGLEESSKQNRLIGERLTITPNTQTDHQIRVSANHKNREFKMEDERQRKMVDEMLNIAATRIQAVFRGFWARDSINVEHFCATLIQGCVRRYLCRMKYRNGFYLQVRYIIRLQSLWRSALARQNLHRSIGAAIVIQALVRGFLGRKLYGTLRNNTQHRKNFLPHIKTKQLSTPRQINDGYSQQGLAFSSTKTQHIGITDHDERRNVNFASVASPAANVVKLNQTTCDGIMRSSTFRNKIVPLRTAQELVPSRSAKEAISKDKPTVGYHVPINFRRITIQDLAAIKIQARYRTHACEQKLIRSFVDILIAQAIVRRWLAKKRADRLRHLRDQTTVAFAPMKTKQSTASIPRLVSRAEFFQNKIAPPQGSSNHYHNVPKSELGPSFDEDELAHNRKESANNRNLLRHPSQSSTDEPGRIRTNAHNVNAGSNPTSLTKMKAQNAIATSEKHASSQSIHWKTANNPTQQQTIHNGLTHRTSLHLTDSRSLSNPIPSHDYEVKSSTSNSNSQRRQVVVTPPVLLKKNTDRIVATRR